MRITRIFLSSDIRVISEIRVIDAATATQRYNLMGQKVNGANGFSVINGQKIMVK